VENTFLGDFFRRKTII